MIRENVLIYGAYGYTGKLIVDLAIKKGYTPEIAGRNKEKIELLAKKYNLSYHVFNSNDHDGWDKALQGKDLLFNCAGPFPLTIKDTLAACFRNNVHYLDINGQIEVFSYISDFGKEAASKGITLLPGVGFDVVPTDCLALYLKQQLPDATHLELAFDSKSGLSRGTALSVLSRFHQGSAVRENGAIVPQKTASVSKEIEFGGKSRNCVGIAWGDVFTAFHTTSILNIMVYTVMPVKTMHTMRRASKWSWLIRIWPISIVLQTIVRKKIDGPSNEKRESLSTSIWGKVVNSKGEERIAELETPESYKLTALTSIMCMEGVLKGDIAPGYTTPAAAFGPDFILAAGGERKLIRK